MQLERRMVKGTMLIDYARMIRANKDLEWNKYLESEDWEIVNKTLLSSSWYPFNFFNRCANASFQILGKGKLELARSDGRRLAKRLFETTYKFVVNSKDPARALKQFVVTYGNMFNFSVLKYENVGPCHVKIHFNHDGLKKDTLPYMHQLIGMLETLVQMTDGRNVKVSITDKIVQGVLECVFDITWV